MPDLTQPKTRKSGQCKAIWYDLMPNPTQSSNHKSGQYKVISADSATVTCFDMNIDRYKKVFLRITTTLEYLVLLFLKLHVFFSTQVQLQSGLHGRPL